MISERCHSVRHCSLLPYSFHLSCQSRIFSHFLCKFCFYVTLWPLDTAMLVYANNAHGPIYFTRTWQVYSMEYPRYIIFYILVYRYFRHTFRIREILRALPSITRRKYKATMPSSVRNRWWQNFWTLYLDTASENAETSLLDQSRHCAVAGQSCELL